MTIDKLNSEISELKSELDVQRNMVQEKENEIKDLQNSHQNELVKKDEEIHGLKRKIDDMSNEFAEMLKVSGIFGTNFKGNSGENAAEN
jgi:predicted  nucleic acid-binding Zn-ribbon protein